MNCTSWDRHASRWDEKNTLGTVIILLFLRPLNRQLADLELVNSIGLTLQCSYYQPAHRDPKKKLPCVIYVNTNFNIVVADSFQSHGNCGSRVNSIIFSTF